MPIPSEASAVSPASSLSLRFQGPYTLTEGSRCLFGCEMRDIPCVYLWTISNEDGRYFIHYVGETYRFAARQRRHLMGILGLDSGIFDVPAARSGKLKRSWDGLWRDKSADSTSKALSHYATATAAVLEYVGAIEIFAARVDGDAQLRKNIEGAIGYNLRERHPDAKLLYPDDNRIGKGMTPRNMRLHISCDAPIAGVDEMIDI
jgi:hypothetical protein